MVDAVGFEPTNPEGSDLQSDSFSLLHTLPGADVENRTLSACLGRAAIHLELIREILFRKHTQRGLLR